MGGIASGRFKHGRYSRYLPTGLRKQYEESKHDPQLLSHEPDLRLIDLHLQELVNKLDKEDPYKALQAIKEAWGVFQQSRTNPNIDSAECLHRVDKEITKEHGQKEEIWAQIQEVLEMRRKILESENRRIRESQTTMSGEQCMALVEYLVECMRGSVNLYADRLLASKILQKLTADIGAIISQPSDSSPGTARLLA